MPERRQHRFQWVILFGGMLLAFGGVEARADPYELYGTARKHFKKRQYKKALGILKRVLAAKPSYKSAHALIGHCYRRLGNNAQAAKHYEIVLRAYPKRADLWDNLGVAYFRLRNYKKAA